MSNTTTIDTSPAAVARLHKELMQMHHHEIDLEAERALATAIRTIEALEKERDAWRDKYDRTVLSNDEAMRIVCDENTKLRAEFASIHEHAIHQRKRAEEAEARVSAVESEVAK
jgi:hypothetical protein